MPILIRCASCGKKLRAPDIAAGKYAQCPNCGQMVQFPPAAEEEPPNPWDVALDDPDASDDNDSIYDRPLPPKPRGRRTRTCPACAETVDAEAIACEHCGENFLGVPRPVKRLRSSEVGTYRSSSAGDGDLSGVDWFLCIICSTIGCIVGIVAICTGDSSRGIKMILFSILAAIVKNAAFAAMRAAGN